MTIVCNNSFIEMSTGFMLVTGLNDGLFGYFTMLIQLQKDPG
jgi:hypothetical protein